jgi:hypothetical protein
MEQLSASSNPNDHRQQLNVSGLGAWIIESETGSITFIGEHNYAEGIRANLWKFLDGGSKAKFVDPGLQFVLLDAQDELIRGDGISGDLKTVLTIDRTEDHGLRRSQFLSTPNPVFIFERGVAVFTPDGSVLWCRNDLRLDHHFQRIEKEKILYSSEHRGHWAYHLLTGSVTDA